MTNEGINKLLYAFRSFEKEVTVGDVTQLANRRDILPKTGDLAQLDKWVVGQASCGGRLLGGIDQHLIP